MHRSNAGVAILQVTSQICLVDQAYQPGKFGFKCGKVRWEKYSSSSISVMLPPGPRQTILRLPNCGLSSSSLKRKVQPLRLSFDEVCVAAMDMKIHNSSSSLRISKGLNAKIFHPQAFMHPPFPSLFSALLYLFLSIILPRILALGIDNPEVLNGNISAFINQLLKEYESPVRIGVAVVRLDPSGTWNVETNGYGVAKLMNGSKVTENTLFPIGSNSKIIRIGGVLVI